MRDATSPVYVVYSHCYADTGEVFYYGSGLPKRPYDIYNRSQVHKSIIRSRGIRVNILSSSLSKKSALKLEHDLINSNYHLGNLINYPPEKWVELGLIAGRKTLESGTGVHGRSPEKMKEDGRKGGIATRDKKVGAMGLSFDQLSNQGKKGGKRGGLKGGVISGMQRWRCDKCGLVTTPGALGTHQSRMGHSGKTRII